MAELIVDACVAEIRRGVEEVYLPIFDWRLTPESAQEMLEAVDDAAHTAKYPVHAQQVNNPQSRVRRREFPDNRQFSWCRWRWKMLSMPVLYGFLYGQSTPKIDLDAR